jgi:hypothetical protein
MSTLSLSLSDVSKRKKERRPRRDGAMAAELGAGRQVAAATLP